MPRARGRQREAAINDRKVLDAARVVFARDGWDAPISTVATEAGVGMGSLYRRYGSKTELLQDLCMLSMRQSISAAERALAAADPSAGLRSYILECVAFGAGAFAPLAGAIPVTDQMITTAKQSNRLLTRLVRRAQAAGVVRGDIDALDVAAVIQRFSRNRPEPRNDAARLDDRVLALTLDGLSAAAGLSLLPPPATPQHLARQWKQPPPGSGECSASARTLGPR